MWRCVFGVGAVLAAAVIAAAEEPPGAADARRVEQAIQAVIARAEPAVVCILVTRPDPADAADTGAARSRDKPRVPDYYGTGVIVQAQDGLVLTNYHVIREAGRIQVRLPGGPGADGGDRPPRAVEATVFAADVRSDLAVLKLPPARGAYAALPLGRGEDLKKGSLVVSLGHPYAAGYRDGSPSASWGIVSNLRRREAGAITESDYGKLPLSQFATLLQTDVRLQLGTSGGALLDLDGKLVGLTTATAALTGVDAPGGFAVPMDAATRRIVDVLLRGAEVEYGFLGVSVNEQSRSRAMIERVVDNSPASRAHLRPGDVIVKVNGRPVRNREDLFLALAVSLAGRAAELVVDRDGRQVTTDAHLVKAPVEIDSTRRRAEEAGVATVRPPAVYGLRVEYTSVLRGEIDIPRGVLVREATAQAAGRELVAYSDIITHVNDVAVNSPAEFYARAGDAAKRGDPVRLTVAGNPSRTVTLP